MIKIEPFLATDSTQVRAMLRYQDEPVPYEVFCTEETLLNSGLLFWQHWLPCRFHLLTSVYVAKEDGVILGLIAVAACGKANSCWRINQLVIHPHHRGRGIAQKLLQYIFALFGSQGVNHFVSEISSLNSPALSLLGGLGFKRAARITYYQMPSDAPSAESENIDFRLATAEDKKSLFQLYQDALPADLRLVYAYKEEDFSLPPLTEDGSDLLKKLTKLKTWYWVNENSDRQVFTAAVKVSTHHQDDFHVEFIIHPGWRHLNKPTINHAIQLLKNLAMKGTIVAKVYDYQSGLAETMEESGWQRKGEFLLMTREHWLRIKKHRPLKLNSTVTIPSIGKPAINLP